MRLSKSLKQIIKDTARDAYAKGVADGERKILTGLKAVAQLNGSAERLLKGGWDENKHPRADDGRFGNKPGEHRGSADGGYTSAEDIEHPTVRAKFERLLRRAPEETRGEVLARAAAEDRRVMRRVEQLRSTAVRSPQTGDPLLVFHGTDQSFDRFADRPTFFTPSAGYDFVRRSPHVHAAYLDMRNPYRTQHPREVEAATYAGREFIDELKAKGYDGIIYSSPDDITKGALGYGDDHPQMVVFSASQIIPVQRYDRDEFDGRLEYDDFAPDGPVQSEALQAYRDAPGPVRKAEPDGSHALIVSAMLQVAEDAAEGGDDPADALKALAALSQDPGRLRDVLAGPQVPDSGTSKLVQKSFDESLHPRDKAGRFISKEKLQAAKSDPELAAELRERVAPKDADKLEAVLSGEADPGRTKRGEQRHQSQQKRAATEADRRRAHRLAMRAFEPGGLGYDDYEELADLLPSLTVEQLRSVRAAVGASWGGQRLRRQGMVDTLVAFARGQAAPPEQDAPGSPGWAARMMNRADEPKAGGVDAWESAKVDDAADRAERMGRWEADKPDSEAARAVAGAARADLAGARGWAGEVATATPKPALPSPDVPEAEPEPANGTELEPNGSAPIAEPVRDAGNPPEPTPDIAAKGSGHNAPAVSGPDRPKVEYVRAAAGGQVSEVDGKFYRGGQLMPVHGQYSGQQKPPSQPTGLAGGQTQASEEGEKRRREPARPLTPEQLAERQEDARTAKLRDDIMAGPLAKLGPVNPHTGRKSNYAGVAFKPWQQFAESVGEDRLKQIVAALPPPTDPGEREHYDWQFNHPQDFAATAPKKHTRAFPTSAAARFAVREELDKVRSDDDMHRLHRILTGQEPPANAPLTPAPSQPVAGPAGAAPAAAAPAGNAAANAPLPALMQPTPYGPQAVVSRGGLVVRDGTGGQNPPSSPVDKPSSNEYTAPESKPSGGKPMTAEAKPVGVSFLSGRSGGDKVPTTAREGDSHVTQGDARIPLLRPLTARHHVGEDDAGVYVTAELSAQDRSDEQKLFRAGIHSLGQPVKWYVAVPTDTGPGAGPGLADALASLRHQKPGRQAAAVARELLPLFDAHPEVRAELARLAGGGR